MQRVSGTTSTPFLYNGRDGVMTDANGFYYMRARYYNPDILRFINRDVLLGSVTDTLSLNRYFYVKGNPVIYIDPSGKLAYLIPLVVELSPEAIAGGAALAGLIVTGVKATGELITEIKNQYFADDQGTNNNSFEDNLNDIIENPDNWEKTDQSVKDATNTKLKGGKSIEEEYTNKVTGDKIWRHILKDKNGKVFQEPHYRPYPKQCR